MGANQSIHRAPESTAHFVPSHHDHSYVSGRVVDTERNSFDLALLESSEDSDDEWEEVECATAAVDRPFVVTPSGSTLPILGNCSQFFTLEVLEGLQPPSFPSASHANGSQRPLYEEAEGLVVEGVAKGSTFTPPLAHLEEIVEQSSPTRASTEGKEETANHRIGELPRKVGSSLNPPTHKPRVSFKEKATELAKYTRGSLVPSKLLPPRDSAIERPSSTAGSGSSSSNKPPRRCTKGVSSPLKATSKLFTSKGFSHHVQNLRKRQAEERRQQCRERYSRTTDEDAERDLTGPMTSFISTQPPDASKPSRKCRARRDTNRKRVTKAQVEVEAVANICRLTKSYVVDVAAVKQRLTQAPQESHHSPPTATSIASPSSSIRTEEMIPAILSRREAPAPLPTPELPSQLLSTSLRGVPQGLKFTRKRKLTPEPGEASSGHGGPLAKDKLKGRLEDSGRELDPSAPRKKPRLGQRRPGTAW